MPDYPEYYKWGLSPCSSARILVVVLGPYSVEIPDRVAFVRIISPTTPIHLQDAEALLRKENPLFFLEPLFPECFEHGLPSSFDDADMVMIAVTGSNKFDIVLAKRIAKQSHSRKILTLGIRELEEGISFKNDPVCPVLEPHVNSMIYGLPVLKSMAVQGNIVQSASTLYRIINGISDPLHYRGFVAMDFADIKIIFSRGGFTPFVSVTAIGVERGKRVGEFAVAVFRTYGINISTDVNLFLSMFGDKSFTLDEVGDATKSVWDAAEINSIKGEGIFSMQELRKSLIDGFTLSMYVPEFHRDFIHYHGKFRRFP